MSGIDLTEATKAAHRALAPRWMSVAAALSEDADYPALLTDVLTAALPYLEQQIRAQIAAEVVADRDAAFNGRSTSSLSSHERAIYAGATRAAAIARTRKDT